MPDKTPLEMAQFTVRFGEEHRTFKDSREYQEAVALLESENGRVERAKDHSLTCAKVRCCMAEADTCRAKCTCKALLDLAREVLDYVHIGTCQAGTFRSNAGIVADSLVERLTPVEVEASTFHASVDNVSAVTAYRTSCCKFNVQPEWAKFCPNCGKPLVWK